MSRWRFPGRTGPRPGDFFVLLLRCRIGPGLCAALLIVTGSVTAEPWRFSHIRTENGLTHNSVYSLLADSEGFIWAGTVDGLNRFDGHTVLTFRHDPLDENSLSSPIVLSMVEEGETIWIGTSDGLDRLDRRTDRVERFALEGRQIQALLLDSEGTLWVGTDHGVFRRAAGDDELHSPLSSHPDLAEIPVSALTTAPDGAIWAVAVLSNEPVKQIVIPFHGGVPSSPLEIEDSWDLIVALTFDLEGGLWITPDRAAIVDHEAGTIRRHPADSADFLVYDTLRTRDGSIWIATGDGPCHRSPGEPRATCRLVVPRGNWLDNYARSLAEGRGGTLWIGTYNGLAWLDPFAKPFRRWRHEPGNEDSLGASAISSIHQEQDGPLWVATFGAGLDRIDRATGRVTHFRHDPHDPDSISADVVWKILPDGEGNLLIGTNRGIVRLDPATERFEPILDLPPRVYAIWGLAIDGEGRVWGSGAGLYWYEPWTRRSGRIDLELDGTGNQYAVNAIMTTGDGTLWAGVGGEGLLFRIDPHTHRWRSYRLEAKGRSLRSEGIWSMRAAADGRLWIGHGRGLSRFDPESESFEHWFESDGLPGSVVYGVELDDRGRLWLGTNRGLVRFDEKSPPGAQFRVFDTSDGIAGMEFNRDAAHRSAEGEMFFGGVDGMTSFRSEEIRDDLRIPSIALTAIELLGPSRTSIVPYGLERLTLGHRDSAVTFEFVALTFTNVGRNHYRYRLVGFDGDWVEAGHRRLARYTRVPPGQYVFQVIGSNQDGVWNEAGVSLPVVVLPPFWQTWWFRLFLLILFGSALYGIHRLRLAKAIEVERVRLRIAGDLHDDLSSELSGMSMMAELIRRREGLPGEERQRLGELRQKSIELAESLRDIAWGIHPEHDTVGAMIRRMRSTAEMLLADVPYVFEVRGLDSEDPMPMSERRNFHLIFKELLHNVVRHASATNVTILLERVEGGALHLTVSDDGRGFDPGVVTDGDGLRNIRRRADRIGAAFELGPTGTGGTRATVRVPGGRRGGWRKLGMVERGDR
jgi:ligand-binding sensor domain-containing protein/signal transduction histidine kinase